MRNLLNHLEFLNESDNESEGKKFKELEKKEKELAIEVNRYINVYDDWFEFAINDFEKSLMDLGIDSIDCQFSGFYSQGDGASFTSKDIDSEEFLQKAIGLKRNPFIEFENYPNNSDLDALMGDLEDLGFSGNKIKADEIYIEFYRSSNSSVHEHSVSVRFEWETETEEMEEDYIEKMEEFLSSLEDKIEEWRLEKCGELYSSLEKEYESLISDEEVERNLIDEDYLLDPETGEII